MNIMLHICSLQSCIMYYCIKSVNSANSQRGKSDTPTQRIR